MDRLKSADQLVRRMDKDSNVKFAFNHYKRQVKALEDYCRTLRKALLKAREALRNG